MKPDTLPMTPVLAFLHTSPVHIARFEGLVQELSPGLQVHHQVDESLLADAQRLGIMDAGVVQRIETAMRTAAMTGARMVVCTCSTIGGVVEGKRDQLGFPVARIDRAMADRAVILGPRILLVAALESTLSPTSELLAESANAIGAQIEIRPLLVDNAWAYFLQGEQTAYVQSITDAIRQQVQDHAADIDVVVLAQASMAAASDELANIGKPVLSSPRLGVAKAVRFLSEPPGLLKYCEDQACWKMANTAPCGSAMTAKRPVPGISLGGT